MFSLEDSMKGKINSKCPQASGAPNPHRAITDTQKNSRYPKNSETPQAPQSTKTSKAPQTSQTLQTPKPPCPQFKSNLIEETILFYPNLQ